MGSGLHVTVMLSPAARQVQEWAGILPDGATVQDAVSASGMAPSASLESGLLGVWGRRADLTQLLRDGDRVEIYRSLTVDPKVARRERFQRQGSRATGLFSRQRPGGKAGY